MPTDPRGEPWPNRTYNGFAGPVAEPPPRRLPRVSGRALAIGGAAAIALGLVLGVWARPNFGKDPGDAAERRAPPVPIEVNRPPPQTALTSNGKLEVLSPDQAAQARAANSYAVPAYVPAAPPPLPAQAYAPAPTSAPRAAPTVSPGNGSGASYREPPPAPAVRAPPLPVPAEPPRIAQAQPQAQPQPQAQAQPAFSCAGGRTLSEAMICGDPEIAAMDRDMAGAYRRAMQSGAAPPAQIRAEQRDWMSIREDAAHRSRRALMQVYRQRLRELNGIAENADGDGPDN